MFHNEVDFRLKANDDDMMYLSFDKNDKMSTHQSTQVQLPNEFEQRISNQPIMNLVIPTRQSNFSSNYFNFENVL